MQYTELPTVWTGDVDSIEKEFRAEDGIAQQLSRSRSRNESEDMIKRALFQRLSQEREVSADQIDVPLERYLDSFLSMRLHDWIKQQICVTISPVDLSTHSICTRTNEIVDSSTLIPTRAKVTDEIALSV